MLIALIAIAAVLLLLVSLLVLPIKLILTAKDDVRLEMRVAFLRFLLYPAKKRKRRKKRKKKTYTDEKPVTGIKPVDKKIEAMSLRDELRLVRALLQTVVRRRKKWLRLHAARLHIRVATGDAAATAVLYGVVCQSLSYLLALLDGVARVKAREPDVSVIADFEGERPSADVKIILSLRVIDVLIAARHLARADKEKRQKQQQSADDEKGN